jgi:hypothetical protein
MRIAVPHHFSADPDPAFHLNANTDPDSEIHFKADPVPDPAFHQSDANLRPLIYRPSRDPF